jgi:hypothetical protein
MSLYKTICLNPYLIKNRMGVNLVAKVDGFHIETTDFRRGNGDGSM